MKTLLTTLNMTVEESANELMNYTKSSSEYEDLLDMVIDRLTFSVSDIRYYNMDCYEFLAIYENIDDIPYDKFMEPYRDVKEGDQYFQLIDRCTTIKGYSESEVIDMMNGDDEFKRWYAWKILEYNDRQVNEIIDRYCEIL